MVRQLLALGFNSLNLTISIRNRGMAYPSKKESGSVKVTFIDTRLG